MTDTSLASASSIYIPHVASALLHRLRADGVRVHAITNAAAQVFTANLLLATGATPSLTIAADEVAAFTERAEALLINLGTLDEERRAAIPRAIATARSQRKLWVLDPVFVDASPPRLDFAKLCLTYGPTILRCNAGEFMALAEEDASPDHVRAFARGQGCVVALTGPTDIVSDGERIIAIYNGHPLMTRVTAMGCAATALLAAFSALHDDALEAAAAALLVTGIAGEIAAEQAKGPGSFQPTFLDTLFALDPVTLTARGRHS